MKNYSKNNLKNGQPIEGGLFSNGLGGKAFSIASYIGEVIIRNTKNTNWEFDPNEPENEMNMMVSSKSGSKIWPMQKLGKRIQNGSEDNIYHYTALIVRSFNEELNDNTVDKKEGISIHQQPTETKYMKKPWWKFW